MKKRALIVDDSRSARVILARMLETHGLHVDTVESGEQALDYLRNSRPDVVFMDHLMPGMDGFETVRAMKNNAQTASIPVMMYTSQEGDAYLRDARKTGAVGVLSKTLKPADVSHALYELNLLPERREERAALSRRSDTVVQLASGSRSGSGTYASPTFSQTIAGNMQATSDREQLEFQQAIAARIDEFSARFNTELRGALAQINASQSPPATRKPLNSFFAVALVLIALIPSVVLATLYWRAINDSKVQLEQSAARLAMVVTEQQTQIDQLRNELRKRERDESSLTADSNPPNLQTLAVPYGELPLAGARSEYVRTLLDRLRAENFHGKLRITSFIGDFCLSGSASKGFLLARDNVSIRRCDLVGNPFEDALSGAQRQSVEFANVLAAAKLPIEIINGGRKVQVPYPTQTDALTAGEWNRIALQNNRVEVAAVDSTP